MRKVTVSCTTTHDRAHLLYYMLESLKWQSVVPDKIMVNLSNSTHLQDTGFSEAPSWLLEKNVQINWVENLGPYRKLLPALAQADETDLIVTADDDILYGKCWLEQLIETAESYPSCIVSSRARAMRKTPFGNWQNYRMWKLIESRQCGMSIMPTSGAGTVYRTSLLDLDFLYDRAFLELAPTTDDLWFRMASLRRGITVLVEPRIDSSSIYLKHDKALFLTNAKKAGGLVGKVYSHSLGYLRGVLGINETENDAAWDRVCKHACE